MAELKSELRSEFRDAVRSARPITATGKRKNAIARVRLSLGNGSIIVNDRRMDEYFPREALRIDVRRPLELTNSIDRFDIKATITGGGVVGQAGALRHGISRALEKHDPGTRPTLKREGMLTRDSRKKERKKYGQKGARARYQFSKR